jgi:DNA topoisomerase IB
MVSLSIEFAVFFEPANSFLDSFNKRISANYPNIMMLNYMRYLDSQESLGGAPFDVEKYKEGIYRKPTETKNVFDYFYVKNNEKVSEEVYKRIKLMRIPPIWEKVWVSSDTDSKIQAVGVDKKGLKQYVYHQNHIKNASEEKFIRVYKFIKAIPKLERGMNKDRSLPLLSKERVIVTILDIIKKLHIRVGKEIYVKRNKSYGISSLRKHHIKIENEVLKMLSLIHI